MGEATNRPGQHLGWRGGRQDPERTTTRRSSCIIHHPSQWGRLPVHTTYPNSDMVASNHWLGEKSPTISLTCLGHEEVQFIHGASYLGGLCLRLVSSRLLVSQGRLRLARQRE